MAQDQDRQADSQANPHEKPRNASDGPPQIDKSPEGASPDRQIAQESQQSSGQGMGQS
ncbi:hypothetical protein [Phenylobacterium deserti]|uniref:hypothetical protein n=1 Tax=Phenylobacterium deserti TaxID=1914756 RepID=UPI001402471B|nr:hypothetical protein [Phenylobacterium deserti]